MITCSSCGKQNQDHYRYCLGCGTELTKQPAGGARGVEEELFDETTQIGAVSRPVQPAPPPPPAEPPPPAPGTCPQCEFVNPPSNRFCASCGFRLDKVKAAAPQPPAVKTRVAEEPAGGVLVALDPEGNEVARHQLPRGRSVIGRQSGGIFAGDAYLSPEHAAFVCDGGRMRVRDEGSLNGTFRKLLADQRQPLAPGQRFRIGQELLVYEPFASADGADGVEPQGAARDGFVGLLSQVLGRRARGPSLAIPERGLNLGRERGDLLFPEDGYVSGLHCRVSYEPADGTVYVTDLGSSNGTFLQILGESELRNGEIILMGQQLYRVTF